MSVSQTTTMPRHERIAFFDSLRGFTILSMIGFHASYDAAYLYGFSLPWFTDPLIQSIWRGSISWVFLLLAGWMTTFSRNNLKRGCVYAAAAFVVFIATSIAGVDTAVTFGILFCMAASTLLAAALKPVLEHIPSPAGLIGALALFALTYTVPQTRYAVSGLSWLGFPSPTFTSGDYYPLIPFFFMYAAGIFSARWFSERHTAGYPAWMVNAHVPVLEQVGKLSLPIYLIHQPVLIVLFSVVTGAW